MSVVRWPFGLRGNRGEVLKGGFADFPANNMLRSDMEDGVKTLRKFSRGYSKTKCTIRFPLDEYQVFRRFVRDNLKDGIKAFTFFHPLHGYMVAAHFIPQEDGRPFATAPAPGRNIFVNFEIDYLDIPLTREQVLA